MVIADGHILHVCPDGEGAAMVHYHLTPDHPLASEYASNGEEVLTWKNVCMKTVELLVEHAFAGRFTTILQMEI